jgi:hypothetical protein
LPFTLISLFLRFAPIAALIIFVTSGAVWLRRRKKGARASGVLLPLVCITAGLLLVPSTWYWVSAARTTKAHLDRIPFTKLLPYPLPGGFDRVEGYAYWNQYGLQFRTSSPGEYSELRINFSDPASSTRLETCLSEGKCDFVTTTPKNRKIYSAWTNSGSVQARQGVREYYAEVQDTLVILSWPHATSSEGTRAARSHEFAPNELETLIDSLEFATSFDLMRFPGMSVMGSGGGGVRSALSARRVIEKSGHAIEIIRPVQSSCIRIRDDGSVEIVGNVRISQNGAPRRCEP